MKKLSYILISLFLMVMGIGDASAQENEDLLSKYAPNDVLEVPAVHPNSQEEAKNIFSYLYYSEVFNFDLYVTDLSNCNGDLTECDVTYNYLEPMTKRLKIEWQNGIASIKNEADKITEYIKGKDITIDDVNLINYYYNNDPFTCKDLLNYSTIFQRNFKDTALKIEYSKLGEISGIDLFPQTGGNIGLYYDGIVYSVINRNVTEHVVNKSNIIYISADTELNTTAFMTAAQKKIDLAIGSGKVKVASAEKLENHYTTEELTILKEIFPDYFDEKNALAYVYYLTFEEKIENSVQPMSTEPIKPNTNYYLIIKEKPIYEKKDLESGVSIKLVNDLLNIKEDLLEVNRVFENSEDYNIILNKLNLKFAQIYDISLYSEKEKISKLDNGEFVISIPLDDKLKGKDLIAYYVDNAGNVERFNVEVEDNMAIFRTYHLSTYAIASKENDVDATNDESNKNIPSDEPAVNTYDAILPLSVLGIISLISMISICSMVCKKKLILIKNKKEPIDWSL